MLRGQTCNGYSPSNLVCLEGLRQGSNRSWGSAFPHVRQTMNLACDASSGRPIRQTCPWASSFGVAFVENESFPFALGGRHLCSVLASMARSSSSLSARALSFTVIAASDTATQGHATSGMLHARSSTVSKSISHQAHLRCPELEPPAERPSAVAHVSVQAPSAARVKAAEGARVAGRSAWTGASTVPRSARDGGDAPTLPVGRLRSAIAGGPRKELADATFPYRAGDD